MRGHQLSTFDINEQIITNQHYSNQYNGEIIDHERLRTLWTLICEENDSQQEYVTEEEWNTWVKFRDNTNRYLESADTPYLVITALQRVAEMVLHPSPTEGQYQDYRGIIRDSVAHVSVENIRTVNQR